MKTKTTFGSAVFNIANYTVLTLFTLLCVFPFYYIFINTISNNDSVAKGLVLLLPTDVHFENYIQIFKLRGLGQATLVSLARTVLGTVGTLIGSSFLGYALSKKEMWHRKFWYRYVIATMYFGAGLIPWFVTMKMLGMINNFLAYVVPGIVGSFNMILFKTYFEQIPASLEESAEVDGAGYIRRFTFIVLPLSTPILATIAIFSSVGQWNSFLDTLFLMHDSSLFTLQFLLYQYLSEVNALAVAIRNSPMAANINPAKLLTPTSIRMTMSMVVVLPILLVYPFFQRYFVKGIMMGAIKG